MGATVVLLVVCPLGSAMAAVKVLVDVKPLQGTLVDGSLVDDELTKSRNAPAPASVTEGRASRNSPSLQRCEPANCAAQRWLAMTRLPRLPLNVAVVNPLSTGRELWCGEKTTPPSRYSTVPAGPAGPGAPVAPMPPLAPAAPAGPIMPTAP